MGPGIGAQYGKPQGGMALLSMAVVAILGPLPSDTKFWRPIIKHHTKHQYQFKQSHYYKLQ